MLSAEYSDSKSDVNSIGSDNPASVECLSDPRASDNPIPLNLFCFLFSDLGLIRMSIFSASKCFSEFIWLSWADLEQVCMKSKANSLDDQATHLEPPLIVRSRTKNYKTKTKSSALHLLVTLEFRKVLSLVNLSPWLWMLILRGLLSFATLTD